jgi:hypothetical protein
MSATQFETQLGYELWHSTKQKIRVSMKWNSGLEELKQLTYENHVKCQSCMFGKQRWNTFLMPDRDKSRSNFSMRSMLIHFQLQPHPLRVITML